MNEESAKAFVFPGDKIVENGDSKYTYGSGTTARDGAIHSVCFGKVHLQNTLVLVTPAKKLKYVAEIGDIIIGRVVEIYNKKWKIECNALHEATLNLGSILLPGVVQRRKGREDEMEMREIYKIDDLIVCEVQKINRNKAFHLHTRSEKYRKLEEGFLFKVPVASVHKTCSFFSYEKFNAVVGSNGYVWIETERYELVRKLKELLVGDVLNFNTIFEELATC